MEFSRKSGMGGVMRCLDIKNLELDGFIGRQSITSNTPAIWFKGIKGAFVHNYRTPEGIGTFLKIDKGTENVTIMRNDLSRAKKIVSIEPGINKKEVFEKGNRLPRDF